MSAKLPIDYLPARMLNEFVYCPRLYFYEQVEGVFAHNRETVEGALRHAKVDDGKGELAPAEELSRGRCHSRPQCHAFQRSLRPDRQDGFDRSRRRGRHSGRL